MITLNCVAVQEYNLELSVAPDIGGFSTFINLPDNPGIYAITNIDTNSIYVGISDSSILSRFRSRLATVFELGFSQRQMSNIIVSIYDLKVQSPHTMTHINNGCVIIKNGQLDVARIDFEALLIQSLLKNSQCSSTNTLKTRSPFVDYLGSNETICLNYAHLRTPNTPTFDFGFTQYVDGLGQFV